MIDDVRTVVGLAGLAPSVHNTQPWRFEWDGISLTVLEDPSRALPVIDPSGRERALSCGAAALHARVALRDLGHECETTLLPDGDEAPAIARLRVTGRHEPTADDNELARAILRRSTDREPYAPRAVPRAALAALAADVEAERGWLREVTGDDSEVEVQVLLAHADESQRSDPAYLEELNRWRRDDAGQGVPDRAVPATPVRQRGSSYALRDFDAGRATGRPDAPSRGDADPPVPERPCVVVLGTAGDERRDWVHGGMAFAALLLRATVLGLAAQPLTQVLEVPVLRGRLRHVLGEIGHPQMMLRVGYGSTGPSTRRLAVDDVLTVVPPAAAD